MAKTANEREVRRVERFRRSKVQPGPLRLAFLRITELAEEGAGTPWAIVLAVSIVLLWAITGPLFSFSETWMLLINTLTTVVTFLMVFVIQSTQNRDAKAMQLKLDELIRAVPGARNEFMEAEEEDLDEILREKEIVDRADPAPPDHKRNGNGIRRR